MLIDVSETERGSRGESAMLLAHLIYLVIFKLKWINDQLSLLGRIMALPSRVDLYVDKSTHTMSVWVSVFGTFFFPPPPRSLYRSIARSFYRSLVSLSLSPAIWWPCPIFKHAKWMLYICTYRSFYWLLHGWSYSLSPSLILLLCVLKWIEKTRIQIECMIRGDSDKLATIQPKNNFSYKNFIEYWTNWTHE